MLFLIRGNLGGQLGDLSFRLFDILGGTGLSFLGCRHLFQKRLFVRLSFLHGTFSILLELCNQFGVLLVVTSSNLETLEHLTSVLRGTRLQGRELLSSLDFLLLVLDLFLLFLVMKCLLDGKNLGFGSSFLDLCFFGQEFLLLLGECFGTNLG